MSHSSLGPFGDQFLSHGLSLGGWLMAHSFWQENVIPSKTCSEKWRGKLWKKWTDLSASFKKIIVCCFCVCMCTWLYSYSYYYCCYLYFLLGGDLGNNPMLLSNPAVWKLALRALPGNWDTTLSINSEDWYNEEIYINDMTDDMT